ncbi:MAG: hypothetical protein HGA87_05390 [Desulfobulbaceae bacterium]|nr:hypothetical protein [Desulfobulbaceae bacterium]
MTSANGKIYIGAILLLLTLMLGILACDKGFPTQPKADLPEDHTSKLSYAYHKSGLYIPETKCTPCHGDSKLKGTVWNKMATPSCRQCHSDIWTGIIGHTIKKVGPDGEAYHKEGLYAPQANCAECHGQDLKGGSFRNTSTPSCYECHKTAVWDWKKTHTLRLTGPDGSGYHNPTDMHNPQVYCTSCHGQTLRGGTFNGSPTKSCYQCHKTAVWDWRSSHTARLTGVDGSGYHQPGYNTPLTKCVSCHGSDLKGGASGRSCYQCHKTAVWDWRSSHTVNISNHWHKPGFFDPATNCTQCHGTDLKGGTSKISCYTSSCHATAVWNWRSTHTVNIGGYGHQAGFFSPSTNCVKCHGSDLRGGLSGRSCYQCHTAVWDWRSTHTRSRDGAMHMSGNNNTCTKCHGTTFTGGISGKSCYGSGCHRTGQPPGD